MSTNNGGPAFPLPSVFDERRGEVTQYGSEGMALRDYFAAKAMQGFVSSWGAHDVTSASDIAHDAYLFADAMLKTREAEE